MKKFPFVIFAVILIMSILVSCSKENGSLQNTQETSLYSLGCQFLTPAQYQALPAAQEIVLKTLPTKVTLPTPPIGNQGSEGSCVAFGTTYAGRSIDWYITMKNTSYTQSTNIFSPSYVYNQIKVSTSCASGAYVTSGLNLLLSQGVCTWSNMPYVDGQCSAMPTAAQKADALPFKISSWGTVKIVTNTIKTYLASNKPVIVAGPVNMAFENLAPGKVLGKFTGTSLGGHCYCVIGYDDSKSAFEFQNSWGPTWASAGFGWISYNYITSWWQEAYVITTTAQ
jgi:C1A family cysteine protease